MKILFHILQFVPSSEMGNLRSVSRGMREVVDKTRELEQIKIKKALELEKIKKALELEKIKKDAKLILKGLPKIKGIIDSIAEMNIETLSSPLYRNIGVFSFNFFRKISQYDDENKTISNNMYNFMMVYALLHKEEIIKNYGMEVFNQIANECSPSNENFNVPENFPYLHALVFGN